MVTIHIIVQKTKLCTFCIAAMFIIYSLKTDQEIPRCREILLMHSDCYENLKQEANAGEANHVATRKLSKHHQTTHTLITTHAPRPQR